MRKTVSTILFDLGGVILNLDYNLTIEAFKKIGGEDFEKRYSQAKQNDIFDRFETGQVESQEFRNYLKKFLKKTVSDTEIDNAWNAMLLDLPEARINFLKRLKQKYTLLLFSNTNAIHLKKFQEIIEIQYGESGLLEQLFDQTYYSHLIGHRKPNQEAFQFILDDRHLSAEEVVFIDDSIQHVEGAKSLGIEAHHLSNTDILTLCKDWL